MDFCTKPIVCKCFGVDTDNAIVSPSASWKAETKELLIIFLLIYFVFSHLHWPHREKLLADDDSLKNTEHASSHDEP